MTSYFFIFELIKELWQTNHKKKIFLILAFLLTILVILSNLVVPLVLQHCIAILSNQSAAYSYLLSIMLIIYGVCWTSSHILSQIREIIVFQLSEECVSALNLRVFKHLHSLDMSFHYERKTGQVMNIITRAQSVFVFILWGFLYIGPTFVEIIIAAGIIFYFYGVLYSALLILTLSLYALFTFFAHRQINDAEEKSQQTESLSASYMVDSLLNAETVKYFNTQQYEFHAYKSLVQNRQNALVEENNQRQLILMGQSLVAGCGLILFTFFSGNAVLKHHIQISDFVLINGYFLQLIFPLVSFGFYARSFKKHINILNELIKIFEIRSGIIDTPHAQIFTVTQIGIEFHNISFWYENKFILDSVSFSIPPGKTVAIVGATGAGKSTIARLIYRLYEINSGQIFINGTDIKLFQRESLQKVIGIVPQDIMLFNNTIHYNIAYGRPNACEHEIKQAAQQAGLAYFIESLPEGFQTIVGERGLKLSGGEKQRIAIARVILKNPLLYIFDEATASLDTITENQIQKNLETIAIGATKIIIAHRLSTITHADEIIVLDKGKIVGQGNHETLLNQNGYYNSLWNQNKKELADF